MRYYEITFGGGPQPYFSSMIEGRHNPNALRVQFSIEKVDQSNVGQHSFLRIMGVNLQTLKGANTYNGVSVTMKAGFYYPGLPLAQAASMPPRTGVMFQGTVFAAFGNWRGNDISLDFIIVPGSGGGAGGGSSSGGGTQSGGNAPTLTAARSRGPGPGRGLMARRAPRAFGPSAQPTDIVSDGLGSLGGAVGSILQSALGTFGSDLGPILGQLAQSFGAGMFRSLPANIIHNMLPGMPLSAAIMQTMTTAFPGKTIKTLISPAMMLTYADAAFHQNLSQYAGYLKTLSASILGGRGISTYLDKNVITHVDWTQPLTGVSLLYSDLIGQPTWYAIDQLQFSSVLRVDLSPPCSVNFPQTLFATTPSPANLGTVSMQTSLAQGCSLTRARFVGDSHSNDGTQWRVDCWGIAGGATAAGAKQAAADANTAYQGKFPGAGATSPQVARLMARKARIFA